MLNLNLMMFDHNEHRANAIDGIIVNYVTNNIASLPKLFCQLLRLGQKRQMLVTEQHRMILSEVYRRIKLMVVAHMNLCEDGMRLDSKIIKAAIRFVYLSSISKRNSMDHLLHYRDLGMLLEGEDREKLWSMLRIRDDEIVQAALSSEYCSQIIDCCTGSKIGKKRKSRELIE